MQSGERKIETLTIDLKDQSMTDLTPLIEEEIQELTADIMAKGEKVRQFILAQLRAQPNGPFAEDGLSARIEVRAGVGGDEALKWAQELFAMYEVVCNQQGWQWEVENTCDDSPTQNIFRAGILSRTSTPINPYGMFRYESGVHRVQRIPFNSDRMQTSAAAVVVLPKIDIPKVSLRDADVKVSLSKKSSGAGGQSVNAAYQQVTLKHLPTGFTVTVADSHAQQENREEAFRRLIKKVQQFEEDKVLLALSETRKSQFTTADRSEKIRTYNFQRAEINDHRVKRVVRESVESFMRNPEELVNSIWAELVEKNENEVITNFLHSCE